MLRALVALILATSLLAPSQAADAPTKFSYLVVCNDPAATRMIDEALRKRLDDAHLPLGARLPAARLIVYAQQDVASAVNTKGWSFAIAHVTNQVTYFAASKIIPLSGPGIDEAKPALIRMVDEQGFLSYLNVAQIDDLNPRTLDVLADRIVGEFVKRWKP